MHVAVVDHQVLAWCLEQIGGDVEHLVAQRASRVGDRASGHRGRPAAARAREAERRDRRVAVAHPHLLDRHAERVGRDLGERGLVTLAVGHLLRVHGHGPVGFEHRARRLALEQPTGSAGHDRLLEVGRSRRGFDERREPEADATPVGARRLLARRPRREIGDLERALERGARRHADVERGAGQHLPRQLVGPDDVAQPDLVSTDAQRARRDVEHALAHPGLDRPGAAVGDVRGLVRRGDGGGEAERRESVRARHHRADQHRVHRRAERERGVRALVHGHVHPHAEQRAVVAQRGFDFERLLARLARDEQVLVAILDPLDRSAEIDGRRQHRDVFAGREHLHTERTADVLRGDARAT